MGYLRDLFRTDTFNYRLFRLIERLLKYMVIAGDILMTCHCLTLLTHTKLWVAEFIGGYSVFGFIALYLASYLLHFCWRYRLCLVHSFLVNCCITFQREFGFGECLTSMRWVMFTTGIVVILLASYSTIMDKFRSDHA